VNPAAWILAEREARASSRRPSRARADLDPWLLGAAAFLMALGLVMVYSASIAWAERSTGNGAHFVLRHAAHIALGLAAFVVTLRLRVRLWERAGPALLLLGMVMLALVLIPGVGGQANGSARWLKLGFFNLQPSELMKLFMVAYVAGYLVRKQETLGNFVQGIAMVSIVVAVVGLLLLMEPDMGSAVVISLVVLTMLFLGGVRFWHFATVVMVGIGGMVVLAMIEPYRMVRVTSFLDPWADPFRSGFQLTQALIAFGRGEWLGVGLGASVQKLFYLYASHSDFVLAVIAEELGLLGVTAVIAASAVIVTRAFAIARAAEDAGQIYGARLAQGIGVLLGFQAIVNMGVNMGALPTKGLTLPFVSYGGSSMIVCCVALGLLARIAREARANSWGEKPA
jgi:cell division protein FtsW